MSDRELLELAAKAYWGDEIDDVCSVEWSEPDQAIAYTHADNQDHNGLDRWLIWNPLEDDGDALRLAVDLKLMVDNVGPFSEAAGFVGQGDDMRRIGCEELHEHHGGDAYAATRRAIVRAAAAIGATQNTGAAS